MKGKIILLAAILCLFCFFGAGTASAAQIQTNHTVMTKTNTMTIINQNGPVVSGSRIVWEQTDSKNHSAIYEKNLASGYIGKVYASNYNQNTPDISGTRIVWAQLSSTGISNIYQKNLLSGFVGKFMLRLKIS